MALAEHELCTFRAPDLFSRDVSGVRGAQALVYRCVDYCLSLFLAIALSLLNLRIMIAHLV